MVLLVIWSSSLELLGLFGSIEIVYESSIQISDHIWGFAKKFILESRSALSANSQRLSRSEGI